MATTSSVVKGLARTMSCDESVVLAYRGPRYMKKVVTNRVAEQIAASRIQKTWKKKKDYTTDDASTYDRVGHPHPGWRSSNEKNFPSLHKMLPSVRGSAAFKANEVWKLIPGPDTADSSKLSKKLTISPVSIAMVEDVEQEVATSPQDGTMYPLRQSLGELFEGYFRETRNPLGDHVTGGDKVLVDFWRVGGGANYRTIFPQMTPEIERAKTNLVEFGTWTVSYRNGIQGKMVHLPILEQLEESFQMYSKQWPSNAEAKPFTMPIK